MRRGRSLGVLTSSTDACLVDAVAAAGLDYLWLDAEHTGLTPGDVTGVVRQLAATTVEVLVRVPSVDFDTLVTYANCGVDELVLPRVRSIDEVRQAWQAVRFPPDGLRPRQVVASTRWGTDHSAVTRLSMIVETVDAADHLVRLRHDGRSALQPLGRPRT